MVKFLIVFVEFLIVSVANRCGENRVRQNDDHHDRRENRRLSDFQTQSWSKAFFLILIDIHQFYVSFVNFLQNLKRNSFFDEQILFRFSIRLLLVEFRSRPRESPTFVGIELEFLQTFR